MNPDDRCFPISQIPPQISLLDQQQCLNLAHQFYDECHAHYSASAQQQQQSQPSFSSSSFSSWGSIYVGPLGSQLYLGLTLYKDDDNKLKQIHSECYNAVALAKMNPCSWATLLESPLMGAMVLFVGASACRGQTKEACANANKALSHISSILDILDVDDCEVLYGRAGSIACILEMRRYLNDQSFGRFFIVRLAAEILRAGYYNSNSNSNSNSNTVGLLWFWDNEQYLGAAHGPTGILQTLLFLTEDDWNLVKPRLEFDPLEWIQRTIQALDAPHFSHPSGNLKSTPRDESDDLVHWCHGAPGHVLLLLRAYTVFKAQHYLVRARKIATDVVWPRGLLKKGLGLCHGISGNALVFCALARVDVDNRPQWWAKAHAYAAFVLSDIRQLIPRPDHPYSLFEGLGGFVYLLYTLAKDPQKAQFPGYIFD